MNTLRSVLSQFEKEGVAVATSSSYLGSFGRHLPSFRDTNLAAPTANITYKIIDANHEGPLSGTYSLPVYTSRLNPKYGAVTDIFSGVSNYHAMIFQLDHHMSR